MSSQEQPNQSPTNEELLTLSEKMLERAQNGYSRQMSAAESGNLSALIAIAGSLIVLARNSEEQLMLMHEIDLPDVGTQQERQA